MDWLRACADGERQQVERRASGLWSSGVWSPFSRIDDWKWDGRVKREQLKHALSRSKNYNPAACGTKTTFTER